MDPQKDEQFLLVTLGTSEEQQKAIEIIKDQHSFHLDTVDYASLKKEKLPGYSLIILPLTRGDSDKIMDTLEEAAFLRAHMPPVLFIYDELTEEVLDIANSFNKSDVVNCNANHDEILFRIRRLLVTSSQSNLLPLGQMLSGIFNQIEEKVMVVDSEHRIVFVNPGLAALIEKEAKEMIGKFCYTFRGLLCGIEHEHNAPGPCGRCRKPITERPHITKSFKTSDGEKYFEISTYPVQPPGAGESFSLRCFKDVTARVFLERELRNQANAIARIVEERTQRLKETKEYLERILEATHDFLFTLDLKGRITYLNRNICKLGYCDSELIGKMFTKLIPDSSFKGFLDSIIKKKEPSSLQVDFLTRTNQLRPHILDAYPLFEGNNRVIGVLGVSRDITEKKIMEAQLLENAKFSFLGQIATGLAHEIKNPLAVIEGTSAYCIKKEPGPGRLKESFKVINRNVNHAQKILNDLLDFARPKPLKTRPLKINTVIKRAIDLVAIDLERSGVQLKLSLCSSSPVVSCDEKQLNQVFFDLVWNARQAMPKGGELVISSSSSHPPPQHMDLECEASNCEKRGNKSFVKISFSDSGIGIDEQPIEKIFDPFYTSKPKGLGLGLSICRRIIEAHGGTIMAESKKGKGTTVSILLPEEEQSINDN